MAPGVIQNSETVINNTLEVIKDEHINGIGDITKTCTIDHLTEKIKTDDKKINGELNEVIPVQLMKLDKKQPRKVTRPVVLKNIESKEYLYDRLYDSSCPRIVSYKNSFIFVIRTI